MIYFFINFLNFTGIYFNNIFIKLITIKLNNYDKKITFKLLY